MFPRILSTLTRPRVPANWREDVETKDRKSVSVNFSAVAEKTFVLIGLPLRHPLTVKLETVPGVTPGTY